MMPWLRACVGCSDDALKATTDFWSQVTDTRAVPASASDVRLESGSVDWHLGITRRDAGPAVRVDMLVDDPHALMNRALDVGATREAGDDLAGRSPGGLCFRIESIEESQPAESPILEHPNGSFSSLDQVCVDIAPSHWDDESVFWEGITGLAARGGSRPEFAVIKAADGHATQLLLQRLNAERPTGAHLDFACSNVAAVTEIHLAAGARLGAEFPWWTVMHDPAGTVYCLTGRNPATG